MAGKIVQYRIKETGANTMYCEIDAKDANTVITKLVQIQCYMGELSLSPNKEIRAVMKWWTTSSKELPYNKYLRRPNSPQSFVSGVLNNMLFGNQNDFSKTQIENLERIITDFTQIQRTIATDSAYSFQKVADNQEVKFQEQYWA